MLRAYIVAGGAQTTATHSCYDVVVVADVVGAVGVIVAPDAVGSVGEVGAVASLAPPEAEAAAEGPAPEPDGSGVWPRKSVYAGGNSMVSGSCVLGSSPPASSCCIKFTGLKEVGGMPDFRVPSDEGGTPPSSLAVVMDRREGARTLAPGAPDMVVIEGRGCAPSCVECKEGREPVSGLVTASGMINGSGS